MKQSFSRRGFTLVAAIAFAVLLISVAALKEQWQKREIKSFALPAGFSYNPRPDYYTEKFRPQYHLSPETTH